MFNADHVHVQIIRVNIAVARPRAAVVYWCVYLLHQLCAQIAFAHACAVRCVCARKRALNAHV